MPEVAPDARPDARPGGADGADGCPAVVLACGLATLDVVQTVEHVPGPDEKLVATDVLVAVGGPAANGAVTARLLGVPARLVTRIGGGALGAAVAGDLAARGVEVVDLAGAGATPPVSTVLVTRSTGQRAVVSVNGTRGGSGAGSGAGSEQGLVSSGVWADVGVLLVDGHHLDLALECATEARRRAVVVVLDGGSWKPGLEHLLQLVDVAVLSADFAVPAEVAAATGIAAATTIDEPSVAHATSGDDARDDAREDARDDALTAVRALGPRVVAQSHGAEPLRLLTGSGVRAIAVPQVEVVDTLGAGDVLHGALAAWLAASAGVPLAADAVARDAEEGLRWAVGVASASVAAAGAHAWAELRDRPRLPRGGGFADGSVDSGSGGDDGGGDGGGGSDGGSGSAGCGSSGPR